MQHLPKHPDSVGGRQAGRQAEAGGQKKNKAGILSPLSGINQQCENILDSGEKTGHRRTEYLTQQISLVALATEISAALLQLRKTCTQPDIQLLCQRDSLKKNTIC